MDSILRAWTEMEPDISIFPDFHDVRCDNTAILYDNNQNSQCILYNNPPQSRYFRPHAAKITTGKVGAKEA